MNRLLYVLIGGAVTATVVLAFFGRQDIGKMGSVDALAGIAFCAALALAACTLIYTPLGRKLRLRVDQKTMDEDDRIRMNARTKGEVRPPMGP